MIYRTCAIIMTANAIAMVGLAIANGNVTAARYACAAAWFAWTTHWVKSGRAPWPLRLGVSALALVAPILAHAETPPPCVAPAETRATLIRAIDGDTVRVRYSNGTEGRLRLWGIDAPELAQAYGREARDYLRMRLDGKSLIVRSIGSGACVDGTYRLPRTLDRYGRELARVFTGDADVNYDMVLTGNAWAYRYGSGPFYRDAQDEARGLRLGLWSKPDPIEPYVYRKLVKAARAAMRAKASG